MGLKIECGLPERTKHTWKDVGGVVPGSVGYILNHRKNSGPEYLVLDAAPDDMHSHISRTPVTNVRFIIDDYGNKHMSYVDRNKVTSSGVLLKGQEEYIYVRMDPKKPLTTFKISQI